MVALTCLESPDLVVGSLDSWSLCNSLRSDEKSLCWHFRGFIPRKPMLIVMKVRRCRASKSASRGPYDQQHSSFRAVTEGEGEEHKYSRHYHHY